MNARPTVPWPSSPTRSVRGAGGAHAAVPVRSVSEACVACDVMVEPDMAAFLPLPRRNARRVSPEGRKPKRPLRDEEVGRAHARCAAHRSSSPNGQELAPCRSAGCRSVEGPDPSAALDDVVAQRTGRSSATGETYDALHGGAEEFSARSVNFFIGNPFDTDWILNPLYLRDDKQVAIQDGRVQLRSVSFLFNNSASFSVQTTAKSREAYVSTRAPNNAYYSGIVVGSDEDLIGALSLNSGKYRVAAYGESDLVEIRVRSTTPWRTRFTSVEWDGSYRPKRRRV